jgi:AcrR family transcriptional regulator
MTSSVRRPVPAPRDGGRPDRPAPPRFRDEFRARLRERFVDAAGEATIERGWDRVRMADVATRCGISRSTLFREFGDKDGLGRALVLREAERVLAQVSEVLREARGWDVGLLAAIATTLRARDHSPLIAAVLDTRHADTTLLPLLTTRGAPFLPRARAVLADYLGAHHPRLSAAALDDAVDTLVRTTLSHLVAPEPDRDATIHRLHRLAQQLLTPQRPR